LTLGDHTINLSGMNMLSDLEICAPLSGEAVPIEDVPDVVFAEKLVGDGVAIRPTGTRMVAPCDGIVGKIFESNDAFVLECAHGVSLFVRFGIDTEELKGEGFLRVAREGEAVRKGDVIIKLDLPVLTQKARSILSPIIVSNMDQITALTKHTGPVTEGETVVLRIKV
jgi:PTS system glucose-specific IIA component